MCAEQKATEIKITNIIDLLNWAEENLSQGDYVFRGQADETWFLKSGATRRVQKNVNTSEYPPQEKVLKYIVELLNDARSLGFDCEGTTSSQCNDLRLLGMLQHFGGATNLLDFSRNILIALWMACSAFHDKDGKIYAYNLNDEKSDILGAKEVHSLTVEELISRSNVTVWIPEHYVSRIQSQCSVFIIAPDESKLACQCREISIDHKHKTKILLELMARFYINESQVYPDLAGFARANRAEMPILDRDENYYIGRGDKYLKQEKYNDAIDCFCKGLDLSPQNGYILFKLGLCHYHQKDYVKAIEYYNMCLKYSPASSVAYHNKGVCQLELKEYEEAIVDFDKSIALDPLSYKAHGNRALAKFRQKKFEEALDAYEAIVKMKPGLSIAYACRSSARYELGKFEEALVDCETAIKQDPRDIEVYLLKSKILKDLSRYDEATLALNHFIVAKPQDKEAIELQKELEILKNKKKKNGRKLRAYVR